MTDPKFCKHCKFSVPDNNSSWTLKCVNPKVNKDSAWALSSSSINGTGCREERERTWITFPACGKAGKQWALKS